MHSRETRIHSFQYNDTYVQSPRRTSQTSHRRPFVIASPSVARAKGATAADTGVLDLVGTALRLCAMCACTRCPAASALQRLSSPASTAAPTIRASRRALSPGLVGCDPRTPRRSSIADCASRIVPPPSVPTSMDGMDTLICRWPFTLLPVSERTEDP